MLNPTPKETPKIAIGHEIKSTIANSLQSVTSASALVKSTLDNTTTVINLLGTACKPLEVEFKVEAASAYMQGIATLQTLGATKDEAIRMLA